MPASYSLPQMSAENDMPLSMPPPVYEKATAPPTILESAGDNINDSDNKTPTHLEKPKSLPTFILQQTPIAPYGTRPIRVTCPSCHEQRITKVEHVSGMKTHLMALALLCTTCCCWIPYVFKSCKNINHHCASCGAYLGSYKN